MFRFLDGPAKGARLNLRRAPLFLRVVMDAGGEIDALDQPDDEPRDSEVIHAYRLVEGSVSRGFACTRGRGGRRCEPFVSADYRLHENQPTDHQARHLEHWREWAEGEAQRLADRDPPAGAAVTPPGAQA